MRTILTTCIAASMMMVSCGGDSLTSEIYESEDGRFKINFLGATPAVSQQAVPTELGDIEITMFMYEKSITEAYVIGYNDYPSAIIEAGSADDMLAGGKDGVVNSMGITQFDLEEEVSLGVTLGYTLKEFRECCTSNTKCI